MTGNLDKKICAILSDYYPNPKSELIFANEYQLIISVVLSAQCTDKKVNQVTPLLFSKYKDFKSLSNASISEIETIIKPINYYKTKAKNLLALSTQIVGQFKGKVPTSFAEIISLPGVGRKTANVVLGELGVLKTLPVDTHVFRVSQRLGWAKGKDPDQIEEQLCKRFDSELWHSLHHWLILHGRRICKAQNPLCAECKLIKLCPTGKLHLRSNKN